MDNATDPRRTAFIRSLRDLADFLEAEPAVTVPCCVIVNAFPQGKEELLACARVGRWKKVFLEGWFCLTREFGPDLKFEVNVQRDVVCRKVVLGTRIVPAQDARVEDVVAWECGDASLLADVPEAMPPADMPEAAPPADDFL